MIRPRLFISLALSGLLAACSDQSPAPDTGSDGATADQRLLEAGGDNGDGAAASQGPFFWGTEVGLTGVVDSADLPRAARQAAELIDDALQLTVVKYRLNQPFGLDGAPMAAGFSSAACLFQGSHWVGDHPNCQQSSERYDLDAIAALFAARGWSMLPMISHAEGSPGAGVHTISDQDLASYVAFVKWFVDRYREQADIRYLELVNAPMVSWKGTPAQLVALQNLTYAALKAAHPALQIGTPGFETFNDTAQALGEPAVAQVSFFLDPQNGATFDFWGFHGYPMRDRLTAYPPTALPRYNSYANVHGILTVREALDAAGWADRPQIDLEHTGLLPLGQPQPTPEQEQLDAAFMLQQLVLKRALRHEDRQLLRGIVPFKIRPRDDGGEGPWASLHPDGSPTQAVSAAAVLYAELDGLIPAGRLSGQWDDSQRVWVERFVGPDGELLAIFKPFGQPAGQPLALDGQVIPHTITLERQPRALTLIGLLGEEQQLEPATAVEVPAENAPRYLRISY